MWRSSSRSRPMKKIDAAIERFFFQPISAAGFGAMRRAWGLIVFLVTLAEWKEVTMYYAETGMLPEVLQPLILRNTLHLTIFEWITAPDAVFTVYLILLASAFL